jgi:phage virion morphogenesis protein
MIKPKVKVETEEEVLARLKKIRAAGQRLPGVLSTIGEILISSAEENFLRGGRYESAGSFRGGNTRWDDLAESTKAARAKKGKWPGQKLQVSGILAASINKTVTKNDVTVGTNMAYARIQQHGGMAGPGHKVKIPARPFLVIQDEDVEEIMAIVARHISKQ